MRNSFFPFFCLLPIFFLLLFENVKLKKWNKIFMLSPAFFLLTFDSLTYTKHLRGHTFSFRHYYIFGKLFKICKKRYLFFFALLHTFLFISFHHTSCCFSTTIILCIIKFPLFMKTKLKLVNRGGSV